VHVCIIFSQFEDKIFYAHSQEIPEAVAAEVSQLNNRIATPTEGHKGAEPLDDEEEDEGVGEEGDHDEDYKRQMEEVHIHCSELRNRQYKIQILGLQNLNLSKLNTHKTLCNTGW
jgi:hypothetical protein